MYKSQQSETQNTIYCIKICCPIHLDRTNLLHKLDFIIHRQLNSGGNLGGYGRVKSYGRLYIGVKPNIQTTGKHCGHHLGELPSFEGVPNLNQTAAQLLNRTFSSTKTKPLANLHQTVFKSC